MECSICLEALAAEGGVGVAPCGHRFHHLCWDRFSSSGSKLLCPNCRRDAPSDLEDVEIGLEEDESIDAIAAAPSDAINDLPPDARASSSSDSLSVGSDSVDTENQSSSVSSGSSVVLGLSSLMISVPNKLDQLMENLGLQSRECGWVAGGQVNQCLPLAISASYIHGIRGNLDDQDAIEKAAMSFDNAITMAVNGSTLSGNFFRRGENQAIDSDVLQFIVANDSAFNQFAFVIVSQARQEFIQAWVGDRYFTHLDTNSISITLH